MLYARTKEGDHDLKVNGKKIIKTVCGLVLPPQKRRPFKWLYVDWKKQPCGVCAALERKRQDDQKGWGTVSGFTDFEMV
jgi:hypothetical protein